MTGSEFDHPFRRAGLFRRVWPFGAALALGFASLPFTDVSQPRLVVTAGALTTAVTLAVALSTTLELLLALGLTAATLAGSLMLADARDGGDWIKAALWPSVAALVGFRTQAVVRNVRRVARIDPLTGAANRARFDEELVREIVRARRSGRPLSIALVDLDHFKRLNDRAGHAAGDEALRASAAAWTEALRATDLISRYGGEEFALLLPEASLEEAVRVAERVRRMTPAPITCSVGVATLTGDEAAKEFLARADAALYRAKREGRNRVEDTGPRVR